MFSVLPSSSPCIPAAYQWSKSQPVSGREGGGLGV